MADVCCSGDGASPRATSGVCSHQPHPDGPDAQTLATASPTSPRSPAVLIDAHTHAVAPSTIARTSETCLAGAVLVSVEESDWDAVEKRTAAMTASRGTVS